MFPHIRGAESHRARLYGYAMGSLWGAENVEPVIVNTGGPPLPGKMEQTKILWHIYLGPT